MGDFGVIKLLQLCQVVRVRQLSPIWNILANTTKDQRMMSLQWEIDSMKAQLNDPHLLFIATNTLFEVVKTLSFEMHNNDAVDTGLNIFILKEEDKRSALAQQAYFAQIYAGESAPTRQDLEVLLQSKPKAPLLPVQLRQQVKRLQITDAILFGTNSINVVALETYLNNLLSREADIYHLMSKILP